MLEIHHSQNQELTDDTIDDITEYMTDDITDDREQIYNGDEYGPLYTDHHAIPKSNQKSIRSDLEKLDFPTGIINIADSIYQDIDLGTKRGKRRKMLIFYCAFRAYSIENITVDPIWLANKCGLERSNISKALSMCSPVADSVITSMISFETPKKYIPVYFNKLGQWLDFPNNTVEDIYGMADEVMMKDPTLNDEKPQIVAAAILVYYMKIHGYTIDKDKYKTIFERSDMTINKIKKKVIKAYME